MASVCQSTVVSSAAGFASRLGSTLETTTYYTVSLLQARAGHVTTASRNMDNLNTYQQLWLTSVRCFSRPPSSYGQILEPVTLRRGTEPLLKITCSRRFSCRAAVASVPSQPAPQLQLSLSSQLAEETRKDFPILDQEVNGSHLVYLDNGATSQKPTHVLNALRDYYERYNSNVHRGVHTLSARATDAYEQSRDKVARFVNAPSSRDIVYTRNASEAINLVAYSWGLTNLRPGDEIVLSVMEHHSNLVPWQLVAERTGAVLKFVGLSSDEGYDMAGYRALLNSRTKLVACNHVSNTLGCINPVSEIVQLAHEHGAKVLLDACQSVPHMPVDVQALDVDWLVASSHKMCGPTGIGFLYGKSEILRSMPPFMGGGEMIKEVQLERSTYAEPPSRFEAGTPAIGEAIGLGAAVDYLTSLGMERIHRAEMELGKYAYEQLSAVPGVRVYGPRPGEDGSNRAALCAFNVDGVHPTDISTLMDETHGVALRSGHHCTQPLHRHLGISSSARVSFYLYNTKEEVDTFIYALKDTIDFFTNIPKF